MLTNRRTQNYNKKVLNQLAQLDRFASKDVFAITPASADHEDTQSVFADLDVSGDESGGTVVHFAHPDSGDK